MRGVTKNDDHSDRSVYAVEVGRRGWVEVRGFHREIRETGRTSQGGQGGEELHRET